MTDQIDARPLRLLVVDDHEVVRQGLVSLLDRREHFQVVAEAGTAAEAVEMARKFEPDLVVMDVRLPDGSGIEACREIRAEFPATRVVILTSYPDEEAVLSAIIAGASGAICSSRSAAATWSAPSSPWAVASRCSIRPSPRRCSTASAASPPAPTPTRWRS
jgi:Response regulator containing a CheY-like receiver domain and an HTH DNA-binding domain